MAENMTHGILCFNFFHMAPHNAKRSGLSENRPLPTGYTMPLGMQKSVSFSNREGAAVSGSTAKTIVFDVGGVIALKSNLKIGANTTIAGQTAPYPGITLRYFTVAPDANNIIVRFIRVRRGQEKDVNDGADAIWTRHYTGQIYDHCSFSWSIDEVASFYDNNNFTMQWCTVAESLNEAGHGKGAHGYGGIWGGKLASFHHNLIAHVNNRSPRFNGARYNWTATGPDKPNRPTSSWSAKSTACCIPATSRSAAPCACISCTNWTTATRQIPYPSTAHC